MNPNVEKMDEVFILLECAVAQLLCLSISLGEPGGAYPSERIVGSACHGIALSLKQADAILSKVEVHHG